MNGFIHTIGIVCKTATDPWKEMNGKNSMSYQLSMENSENISLLLDRYKTLFELLEQNKMNLVKSFLSFDVRWLKEITEA